MRIVPVCSTLLSMLLVLACSSTKEDGEDGTGSGDATSDGGDDGGDDGASDDGGTGSGGGGSETGDDGDDGGTGSGGTSDAGDGGTTSGDDGTTSGDDGTTSGDDGTTSGQGNVEYAAFAVPGGLDRIMIRKADHDDDLCVSLVLMWPSELPVPFPDVTTPAQWAVETAAIFQGTTQCLDQAGVPPGPMEHADTASGHVDFEFNTPGAFPCSLDVSVSMTFPTTLPWVPEADSMAALAVPVQGC